MSGGHIMFFSICHALKVEWGEKVAFNDVFIWEMSKIAQRGHSITMCKRRGGVRGSVESPRGVMWQILDSM